LEYKFSENCLDFWWQYKYKFLNSQFYYAQNISLSDNVHIGDYADIDGRGGVFIQKGVVMLKHVSIYSSEHYFDGGDLKAIPFDNRIILKPVYIGEYTWIGRDAIILSGVKIGKGAIIGAGSVVSKDIPDYAIAVGNPAVVKKYRDKNIFEKLCEQEQYVFSIFGHEKELIE